MSTWQARRYYSSDEQSQIISKLIQKDILAKAETRKIQDDLIQLGDLSDSQLSITEFFAAKVASAFTVWKLPLEPDHDRSRLWLHATNSVMLPDLSDFGAIAKFYGNFPKMILGYDDGVTGNVLNPFLDGITNYLRVKDNPNIRLNNIVGTKAGISFVLRAFTTSLSQIIGGPSITFDKTNWITVPYNAIFDNLSSFTISCWIYRTAYGGAQAPVYVHKGYPNPGWFALQEDGTGNVYFTVKGAVTQVSSAHSNLALLNNAWHFIAATYDGATIKLYINGVLANTTTAAVGTLTNNAPLEISHVAGSTSIFTGSMADVRLYNNALTLTQIMNLYQNIDITIGLVIKFDFHEGSGTTTTDIISSLVGTFVNSPAWTQNFKSSNRFFFSKVDDDLVTYGYEAFFDFAGVIYFIVRKNGVDYKMKTAAPAITVLPDLSDFSNFDYKPADFYTTQQPVYDPSMLIDEYVFTFKFSDNSMQIYKNAVLLSLVSTTEPPVFPAPISNPPPLNNANLLTVTMTASGGTNVAFSNDANLTTRWEQLSLPAYLVADLGQIKTIGYVQIAWYRASLGRIQTFQILVSDDNITYVQVFTGSGLGTDALQRYDFPDVTGRYVKLNITANSEGASASVYEFQVWGFDPISVVYPIDTLYNVPITGGDYFDLYSTPTSSSTDPIFGVTGTNSTDVQLRNDSGKTTVYTIGGSGSGIALHAALTSSNIFNATTSGTLWAPFGTHQCLRIGLKVADSSSVFVGQKVTQVVAKLKRTGTISGSSPYLTIGLYDSSGTLYSGQASSHLDANSISTSFASYTLTLTGCPTISVGDFLYMTMTNFSETGSEIDVNVADPPTSGGDGTHTIGYYMDYSFINAQLPGSTSIDVIWSVTAAIPAVTHIIAEYINSTSSVFWGKVISQVTIKMSATGSPSGSIYCRIRKAGGALIAADATIPASSLTTSFVAYTYNFTGNAYVTAINDQLEVQFDGVAGPNWVNVQYDTSGYDTTNSILRLQDTSNVWTTDTAKDLAGTMLINNAPPIISAGEYIDDNLSVLFAQTIVKVTFKLARIGTGGGGNVNAYILLSGGTLITSTTTIAASTLPVSTGSNYAATDFLFSTNAHVGAQFDTIYVHVTGGDTSNYVVVQREVGSASGDGVHTTMRTQTLDGVWTNTTTDDTACTFYVSTIIPATIENRVVMNCAGDFGTFVNHVLNDFTFYLKKLGAPTGTIYFRIRDINDAVVQDLGNYNAASLLTTGNTTIHFVNIPTFTHRLVKGDKITVEYTSVTGISADRVKVQQNDRSWFGDPDTNEQGYNNIVYSTVSNRIFAGIYKEGGQTVIFQEIDLAQEDVAVQPGYSHDLFVFACAEFEQLSQTWTLKQGFWKGIASQFRIYYDLLTLTQIQNLYANKISISTINYGEVLTGGDIMNLQP
jgi:hypothetical protein